MIPGLNCVCLSLQQTKCINWLSTERRSTIPVNNGNVELKINLGAALLSLRFSVMVRILETTFSVHNLNKNIA